MDLLFVKKTLASKNLHKILNQNQNIKDNFFIHMNVRSLSKWVNKIENFLAMLPYTSEIIVIGETKLNNDNQNYVPNPY